MRKGAGCLPPPQPLSATNPPSLSTCCRKSLNSPCHGGINFSDLAKVPPQFRLAAPNLPYHRTFRTKGHQLPMPLATQRHNPDFRTRVCKSRAICSAKIENPNKGASELPMPWGFSHFEAPWGAALPRGWH